MLSHCVALVAGCIPVMVFARSIVRVRSEELPRTPTSKRLSSQQNRRESRYGGYYRHGSCSSCSSFPKNRSASVSETNSNWSS